MLASRISALCVAMILAVTVARPAMAVTVVGTETVLNRVFGVNLHLDNCCKSDYRDLTRVIAELRYIGARRLRDWADHDDQVEAWKTVHQGTGARFHASIPEGSPEIQRQSLARMLDWLGRYPGLIEVIEGGNEEDSPFALGRGASLADTAALQAEVYAKGRAAGVTVAQMTVGSGWRPPLYEGHYKSFGTPPADLGNAHVYMNANSPPMISLTRIGGLAAYSVPGKPVDVTEFGIYQKLPQTDAQTSAYMHEAPFDAFSLGYAGLSVYALHDDASGVLSFYSLSGMKRPFADYWHATTTLLADPGGAQLPPKELPISFAGRGTGPAPLGVRNLAMYKSDGSLWIAAYDEERKGTPDGSETITLDRSYATVTVVSGRDGSTVASFSNTQTVTLALPPNHVFFVVAK